MKILIAEDEPDIWKPYKIALEARNHDVIITEDGEQSLKTYRRQLLNQKKKATNEFSRNATTTRKTKTKAKKKKTKLQQPFERSY